jgi:DNA repair protein RecN (Recombination protein N)
MLRYLCLRDFVIVDELELELSPGFSALTGETGAGKSILVDAISLLLGARGDASVIRAGATRADLSAEFELAQLSQVASWLEQNELGSESCLLRRVIDSSGRSRAFVNGSPVSLQQLRELGEKLIEIQGQHAHQSLLKDEFQRELLDSFGGLTATAREVREAYRRWQALKRRRQDHAENAVALAADRERLAWQVNELDALKLSPDEWWELNEEHGRLAHAASLIEGAENGLHELSESEAACLSRLTQVLNRIGALQAYDPRLEETRALLDSARIQLTEAVYDLRDYRRGLELDPQRLAQVERRLEAIHAAARKYRVKPEALPDLLQSLRTKLSELGDEHDLEELAKHEAEAESAYRASAAELSAGRQRAAQRLTGEVSASMQKLAMEGGRFAVSLSKLPDGNAGGLERVEFQVAAHKGIDPAPLAKVASGGELSRVSLALQAVASKAATVPTLIFDEVDVGIGGRVAEIVGRLLRLLGRERQVLCVTHLPQVAAAADTQWRVEKRPVNSTVLSRIELLDARERVEELARMLGGVKITDITRRHAAEMLQFSRDNR